LTQATGDQIPAIVLKWIAAAALILLVVDLLLLVLALGVNAAMRGDDESGST
jgi:hypothetical protein